MAEGTGGSGIGGSGRAGSGGSNASGTGGTTAGSNGNTDGGSGGSISSCTTPTAPSALVGSWVFGYPGQQSFVLTFANNNIYEFDILLILSSSIEEVKTTGQYSVSGCSLTFLPEQSTCDVPMATTTGTFSIANGTLELCQPGMCTTYSANSDGGLGPNVTAGCSMSNGPFVAQPLGPLPPGDGG